MVRRMVVWLVTVVSLLSLVSFAQSAPVVVQPLQAGYSSALLTEFQNAVTNLERTLANHLLGSKKNLGSGGWTYQQFAAYTAGSLQRMGYTLVEVVVNTDSTGVARAWVLVGISLTDGSTAWVPVDPFPSDLPYQHDLGDVAWSGSMQFDAAFVAYHEVVQLSENMLPIARIRPPINDVVETKQSAWFGNTSVDPDGEIVLYQWTFGEHVQPATYTLSVWYTFESGGQDYPVTLTVTDSRGAQASTTTSVYVMTLEEEEADNCGCHD